MDNSLNLSCLQKFLEVQLKWISFSFSITDNGEKEGKIFNHPER
jgi:hypothetical protein